MSDKIKLELIEATEKNIEDAIRVLKCSTLTNTPFIIQVGSVYLNPAIKDGKTIPEQCGFGRPWEVNRFSRKNAELIASVCSNSAGENGQVIGYVKATESYLKTQKELFTFLTSETE